MSTQKVETGEQKHIHRTHCAVGTSMAEVGDGSTWAQPELWVSAVGMQGAFVKLSANCLKVGNFY